MRDVFHPNRDESATQKGRGLRRKGLFSNIAERPLLYLMVAPGLIYFFLFFIIPILGNIIAWMDYNYILGFKASPWVGWRHFEKMFSYSEFPRILKNTVIMGVLKILIDFPVPIILALLLNEIRSAWFKKFSQTVVIIPYFLSWVIVARLVYSILHPDSGAVNILAGALGGKSIFYMTKSELFPLIVVLAGSWQGAGYSCIVYLAALTTMDRSLFEAAEIDGANRWQQTAKITLPLLMPVAMVMLLVNIGNFLNLGFNQIENLYNPVVRSTGEILANYIFNVGINKGEYSFASAVGIFQAVVGLTLVLLGQLIAVKTTGRGLFYVPKAKNQD